MQSTPLHSKAKPCLSIQFSDSLATDRGLYSTKSLFYFIFTTQQHILQRMQINGEM